MATTKEAGVKPKKATRKKATVTKKVTEKRAVQKKGARRAKPKTSVKKVAQKKPLPPTEVSIQRSVTALMVLRPVALPLNVDQLAIASARYGGLFFALLGGLFGLYHLHALGDTLASYDAHVLQATVCATEYTDCLVGSSTASENTTTTLPESVTVSDKTVRATPEVSFSFSSDALTGVVPIRISVAEAKQVNIDVFHTVTNKQIALGEAVNTNGSEWNIQWDTETVPDGTYTIRALVTNAYGHYDAYAPVKATIEHTSHIDVDENIPPSDTESAPEAIVTLTPDGVASSDIVLTVDVLDADSVRAEIQQIRSLREYTLPKARFKNNARWEISIDTTLYPDSEYRMHIFATVHGEEYLVKTKNIVIQNTTEQASSAVNTKEEEYAEKETSTMRLDSPEIELTLPSDPETLSGVVDLTVRTTHADFVEVYVQDTSAFVPRFIGLATRVHSDFWAHAINTTYIPNGTYHVYVRVKNSFGTYESTRIVRTILNVARQKEDNPLLSTELQKVVAEKIATTPVVKDVLLEDLPSSTASEVLPVDTVHQLLTTHERDIQDELNRYSAALHTGEARIISEAAERLEELKTRVGEGSGADELTAVEITKYIDRFKVDVERIDLALKERVGEELTKDFDKDGITDYDEIALYATDPMSADTDQDGFIDGAEILSGYDPLNPLRETYIEYESPREVGFVRSDVLRVESISPDDTQISDTESQKSTAVFSGKALPYSFVTLYIFSTPIIVTVKTDSEGSWIYRFDKELEDGEHEVYVGITDNAGKIVAKSEPFRFVKEAEAFSPVDGNAVLGITPEPAEDVSLISSRVLLVVMSISVVGIGVVLMLIGLHVSTRQKLDFAEARNVQPVT